MKLKINQELKDAEGKSIIAIEGKPKLLLKDVCITSILSPIKDDDEKLKFNKYEIFKKLRDSKAEVELTAEEIALLKKCIAFFQPQLIMGQCFEMIEK
jgi:N6-adenosine-specific RNA methylase IME4